MTKSSTLNTLRYLPKLWATLVYFLLFIVVMYLFMGRSFDAIRIPFLMDAMPNFYHHISNFSISLMIVLVVGYVSLLKDRSFKLPLIMSGLLILANFLYEGMIPVLNTRDWVDAWYGLVGSVVPLVFLVFYRQYGLQRNPDFLSTK